MVAQNYQRNREQILKNLRERRARNPKKHRKEVKDWKLGNRDKLLAQKRRHYRNNQAEILEKRRKRRAELKQQIRETFGIRCIFCSYEGPKRLHLHEIYGKKHTPSRVYILQHKENFVLLCPEDHRMVSRMMSVFGLSWQDILRLKSGN